MQNMIYLIPWKFTENHVACEKLEAKLSALLLKATSGNHPGITQHVKNIAYTYAFGFETSL